ncbi:hypothetical protein JOM56_014037 [Amanita muscaria]
MAEQPPAAIPSAQEQNELPTYGTGVWISYKIDFRTRVRSSLRSLARFLRIMSQPSNDVFEEFKGLKAHASDVETYYYFLSDLYKSANTWSLDRNRWMITKISTYKSTGLFEHECLVADVECEGQKVYLRFERKRSKKPSKAPNGGDTSNAKSQASDDSDPDNITDPSEDNRPTGGSSSGSSSRRALDTILFAKTLENLVNPTECVEVLQFSEGKGLSLSQITVLARCVNNTGRMYHLLKANCYWFAHLVVQTAKLIEKDCKAESKSNKKPGEWLRFLPITKNEPEVIQDVKAKYDELWAKFDDDIHKSVNNESSPVFIAERKAKEEERKAKEEERRKREEAERQVENAEERIKKLEAALLAAQASNGANGSS